MLLIGNVTSLFIVSFHFLTAKYEISLNELEYGCRFGCNMLESAQKFNTK